MEHNFSSERPTSVPPAGSISNTLDAKSSNSVLGVEAKGSVPETKGSTPGIVDDPPAYTVNFADQSDIAYKIKVKEFFITAFTWFGDIFNICFLAIGNFLPTYALYGGIGFFISRVVDLFRIRETNNKITLLENTNTYEARQLKNLSVSIDGIQIAPAIKTTEKIIAKLNITTSTEIIKKQHLSRISVYATLIVSILIQGAGMLSIALAPTSLIEISLTLFAIAILLPKLVTYFENKGYKPVEKN
jgi:hypothetical protein